MKRSDHLIIVCIFFALICCVGSDELDENIQRICSRRDYKVLSVFNLHLDIILQLQEPKTKKVEFWRIADIVPEMPIIGEKKLSRETRAYLFSSGFIENGTKFPSYIDEDQRVFGYHIPIVKSVEWAEAQGLPPKAVREFKLVINSTEFHFVCIHGFKKGVTKKLIQALIYRQHESKVDGTNMELDHIHIDELQKFMDDRCMPNQIEYYPPFVNLALNELPQPLHEGHDHNILSFINWPEFDFDTDTYNNITLIQQNYNTGEVSNEVIFLALERGNGTTIVTWSDYQHRYRYHQIFQYNNYYKYFICGEDCTLDTKLYWLTLTQVDSDNSRLEWNHPSSNISIAKLLSCPTKVQVAPEADPSSFCQNTEGIQSIFNLGTDLYIQTSSRFWRYPFNQFTNESNPLLKPGSPIRLEPTVGAILSLDGFDTNKPIIGFSYTIPRSDWCKKDDNHCNQLHRKSQYIYGVCLYGKQFTAGQKEADNYASDHYYSYFYTPYGLTKFVDPELIQQTLPFCGQMWGNYIDKFESAATYTDKNVDISPGYLFLLYKEGEKMVIKSTYWATKDAALPSKGDIYSGMENSNATRSARSIFFFKYRTYYYDVNVISRQSFRPESLFDPNIYTANAFFNCPFESIGPFVPMKVEDVCEETPEENLRHYAQSVFNIGKEHYHQIGPYFYVYRHSFKSFKYDQGVSDVLNDYFDTSHRLTAYSIDFKYDMFEVVFHGKSSANFKSLGENIFALFKYNESIHYLEVIKAVEVSSHDVNMTIGVLATFFIQFGFIDAMGTLRSGEMENRLVWINEYEDTELIELMDEPNPKGALMPLNMAWEFQKFSYYQISFKDVKGIFHDHDLKNESVLYLVAHPRDGNKSELSLYYMMREDNPDLIELITRYSKKFSYRESYCLSAENITTKSESTFAAKMLSKVLSVLLIILLVLSLVVGFYSNRQKTNIHSVANPKVNAPGQPGPSSERQK